MKQAFGSGWNDHSHSVTTSKPHIAITTHIGNSGMHKSCLRARGTLQSQLIVKYRAVLIFQRGSPPTFGY